MLYFSFPPDLSMALEMTKRKDAKNVFKAIPGKGRLGRRTASIWLQHFKDIH